jgi:hypothetical protein
MNVENPSNQSWQRRFKLDPFASDLEDILRDQPLLPKGGIWD